MSMSNAPAPAVQNLAPLDELARAELRALVEREGELRVMRKFGLSRTSIARGAAGFPLFHGTREVILAGLRQHR